ncbi:MAG: succinate dehydrogenase cytochrome b558 subunit [Chlamydiia bacterium]|nr:succinate dehydrogenase cytochrome b558 subunit [Chlamydiia bacterium]
MESYKIPSDFIWRRLHSLAGLALSLFIIFHLFTNSQAALPLGEYGKGFVKDVNWIHDLPFLPLLEIGLIGAPFLLHALWGLHYLFTGRPNSQSNPGNKPYLDYGRNKAYTWQRITAWILLVAVTAHVVHMRFLEYPEVTHEGTKTLYTVTVSDDPGLKGLQRPMGYTMEQESGDDVKITADNFGTTALMVVRDTFKSPLMMGLYTILVLSACYHGFNGLWTFMITWGVTLTERSQSLWLKVCKGLMIIVAFLGLAAIFGTYWLNLRG